ncbi:MAG: BTAD domain-containing putative transcriptional regulator, partial [Pseudomonas sp.]
YDRLHRRARRERIKQLLEAGDRAGALAVAQRWSELDPVEDEAHHRTIELLHELGRRAEALHTFDGYAARLKEIDLVPLEETRALAARVRASSTSPVETRPVPLPVPVPVASPAPQPVAIQAEVIRQRWAKRPVFRVGAPIAAAVVLLAAGVPVWRALNDQPRMAALPIDSLGYDKSRVAVLYFDDNTEGGKLDYVAKGLTEALIQELSRVEALSVISRNGVKPYQNSNAPLDSIVRALKVGTIVSGSVQQSRDNIRVSVQVTDARDMSSTPISTFERPLRAGFQLEDDAVQEVGKFLRRHVGQQIQMQHIARGVTSQEAYRLYQVADDFREQVLSANPRLRVADAAKYEFLLQSADSMLVSAHRLDERWVEPILLRGWLALDRGVFTAGPGSDTSNAFLRTAIEFADDALQLDRANAAAFELRGTAKMHIAGNVVNGDTAGAALQRAAELDLKEAVAKDKSRASAWARLSRLRHLSGALDEASLYAQRALQADAFQRGSQQIINRLIGIEMDRNRFDEADQHCRNGHEQFPSDYQFLECFLVLSAANPNRAGLITMDSAYNVLMALRQLDPPRSSSDYTPVFRETLIARLWAKHGQRDSALAILSRARRTAATNSLLQSALPFDAAHVLLLVGDTTAAIQELNSFLRQNPRFHDYVRNGVAFRAIAERLVPPRQAH